MNERKPSQDDIIETEEEGISEAIVEVTTAQTGDIVTPFVDNEI